MRPERFFKPLDHMNTIPSHLVINAAIEKRFDAKFKLARSAFLWGEIKGEL